MDQIQQMVEARAELGIGESQSRQLAVDRIEDAHDESAGKADRILAESECGHGGDPQQDVESRHPVRMHAQARQRPHQAPNHERVDVAREEIGRALVARPEHEPLGALAIGVVANRKQPEGQIAAQPADIGGKIGLLERPYRSGSRQRARQLFKAASFGQARGDLLRIDRQRRRCAIERRKAGLVVRGELEETLIDDGLRRNGHDPFLAFAKESLEAAGRQARRTSNLDTVTAHQIGGQLWQIASADVDADIPDAPPQPHCRANMAFYQRHSEDVQVGTCRSIDPKAQREPRGWRYQKLSHYYRLV